MARSGRQSALLAEKMDELNQAHGSDLAAIKAKMSQAESDWGKLLGRLVQAKAAVDQDAADFFANFQSFNEKVEGCFAWWSAKFNNGKPLTNTEKITAFFHVVGMSGIDDDGYRDARALFKTIL